ncbi:hypothetical protein MES5069_160002 [Mesorhizobium escarrei]|uniref:Recombinase domain-containing protein n=1 Tax=Mesorhizobium escarrei TaxID=666018 RepID=A0ABN8JJ00_9HYPH|nr:hypothetical protein MES5069_160002 [Mesorhizobium escarrei]
MAASIVLMSRRRSSFTSRLYDPAYFNDRMLLGLKGTMSEAELHILKSRLQGGILNKARRGELEMPLPIGLVYTPDARVVLDPDRQIQNTVRLLFDTFRETGSACAVVRRLRGEKILFPRRIRRGIGKGDVLWSEIDHSRVLQILHNRDMPAHSPMGARAPPTMPSSSPCSCAWRDPTGRCLYPTPTKATFPGPSTSAIRLPWNRTPPAFHLACADACPARAAVCCRDGCCAAAAVHACASITSHSRGGCARIMSATKPSCGTPANIANGCAALQSTTR